MKAASLFLIFVAAKLAILWGHAAPWTLAALPAYLWQDALAALLFAGLELCLEKSAWVIYWALVLYTCLNIPVGRAVFTPLTMPMLRAARGPLADSILEYVTALNVLLMAAVLAAAAILPRLLKCLPMKATLACAVALVLMGPGAARRVDTRGMDRNVITALIGSAVPPAEGGARPVNWRDSSFRTQESLTHWRGVAQGSNVVMVSLESTAAQYLSLYGAAGRDAMPNLSLLAQHALVFENAYAVYPESIKGLFSILCSRIPAMNSRPEEYQRLACHSLAEVLSAAGYRTAMFHSGRFGYLGMEAIVRNRGYQTLEDAGDIGGNQESSFGVDEPATVVRMLAWIDSLPRGQRFFLNYLPIAGHHPYATPQPGPFRINAEVDQYRNALHYGDASLGALIEGLRARGLEQNTMWVIYGDHGEAFQQHEGNYGHTFFLYEENVHVPLLIAAPSMTSEERVPNVVSLLDVAPTILDLLAIARPQDYEGRTVLDETPRMALFFTDYSLQLVGLRDGPWKLIYEMGSGRMKLFDVERDPREQCNQAEFLTRPDRSRPADRGEPVRQIAQWWRVHHPRAK